MKNVLLLTCSEAKFATGRVLLNGLRKVLADVSNPFFSFFYSVLHIRLFKNYAKSIALQSQFLGKNHPQFYVCCILVRSGQSIHICKPISSDVNIENFKNTQSLESSFFSTQIKINHHLRVIHMHNK